MTARYAALVLACTLVACRAGEVPRTTAPPPRAATPATGLPNAEPAVRIGITVDSASATVGATGGFTIRATGGDELARGRAGEAWTFTADEQGRVAARSPAGAVQPRPSLRVIPDAGSLLTIGGRQYRGEALVVARGPNRLTAVNVVDLEQYLLGVVPHEMGRLPANLIEALKVQAVAARTYAIGNLGSRSASGFDFYATIMDQVYGGTANEDTIVSRAVMETRGEIMTYDGAPIIAYYSSTCGGETAAIDESWPSRAPQPYLRSVSDRIPNSEQYYCSTSNRFNWETRWTRDELLAVLRETLRTHTGGTVTAVQRVTDVRVLGRGPSGRATVRLVADGRSYDLRADSVRWVFRPRPGPAILNSSRIYDLQTTTADGAVNTLAIRGGGWGHAIGMCQVGAMGRARAGHRYDAILRAYYTGVELRKLY
ncbi:MAG TPA: SpoIID/LytB domain-containing protein [Longimicrobiales bacterium]|nr:SpoIID/LytB domain-containing protein [Longimicrobiales bacterium]